MASGNFQELLDRMRAGSNEAVRELLEHCSPAVYRAIRRRLGKHYRPTYDSADVAQAVWASLLVGSLRDREFETLEDFVKYVASVASNKAARPAGRRRAAALAKSPNVQLDSEIVEEHLAVESSPSHVMTEKETLSGALRGISEREREILQLYSEGKKYPEIAGRLHLHPGTVRRMIHELLTKLRTRDSSH